MYKEKYEALKIEFDQLRESHDAMAARLERLINDSPSREAAAVAAAENGGRYPTSSSPIVSQSSPIPPERSIARDLRDVKPAVVGYELGEIYDFVRDRAAKEDPKTLRLLLDAPEIEVRRDRKIIAMDEHNLKGSIAILIAEKFFDPGCEFVDVRRELIRRGMLGTKAPNQQISQSLQSIVELGFLTKETENTYKAVAGMKVNIVESTK